MTSLLETVTNCWLLSNHKTVSNDGFTCLQTIRGQAGINHVFQDPKKQLLTNLATCSHGFCPGLIILILTKALAKELCFLPGVNS